MSRDAQDHEATDGPSRPERRLDELGREAFQLAVTSATKAAAQEIARIHRVRLVTQTALVTAVVALAVVFAGALVLYADQLSVARNNSLYNCQLVRHLSAPLADFVTTEAHLRDAQAHLSVASALIKGFGKIVDNHTLATAQRESAKLNAETLHFWSSSIVPRLDAVAASNCDSHVH